MASRLALPLLLLADILFPAPASPAAPLLDPSELAALKEIARKLGVRNWDFIVDPCSGEGNWKAVDSDNWIQSGVGCDCTFANGSHCYITNITLMGQNLTGELAREFVQLRHLRQLDLSRNVINGTVPEEWENLKLEYLSIEGNVFSGSIPSEIGRLVNLEKIVLSANKFSGELPPAIGTLANLTELKISSNNFTGKIPQFIAKLTRLQILYIQGCPLEGPIPPSFSALTKMTDLRISDLKIGIESDIPDFSKMVSLEKLLLRNCSIHGTIPSYIGNFNSLKYLDLSFNKLTGEIPSSFVYLKRVNFIYLTRNMLSGTIPGWIRNRIKSAQVHISRLWQILRFFYAPHYSRPQPVRTQAQPS